MEKKKLTLKYLIAILIALALSYLLIYFFHPILVSGSSMYPTLNDGDLMLSTTSFESKDIKRGDIVVFKDKLQLIKRVIAVGGDEIWVANGIVFVNGIPSQFQFERIKDPGILDQHIIIPEGQFFCMGDNRNDSYDCREIGPVTADQMRYKIIKKLFTIPFI